jgi:hypothetical protein
MVIVHLLHPGQWCKFSISASQYVSEFSMPHYLFFQTTQQPIVLHDQIQCTKYDFEQMRKLTGAENEEDPTVDNVFNATVVVGNLPHEKNNMPTWMGDDKMYAMLECNDQHNQQALEQAVEDGFFLALFM